jgi:hypothetical protein
MRRFTLVVALLFVPVILQAQVRGGGGVHAGVAAHPMISAPRPSSAAPSFRSAPPAGGTTVYHGAPGRIVPSGSTRGTAVGRPVSRMTNSSAAFDQRNSLPDFTSVPGLGFDYVHLAAVHPNQFNQRGRRNFFPNGSIGFFPFFDSGFLLPYTPSYLSGQSDDGYVAQDQPPTYTQNDVASQGSDRPDPRYGLQNATAPYDVVVTPPKQSEPYVFVCRDGTVFFAVAYSWQSGNLLYVTQDGFRRTVTRDALDLDATQQFNEQRGLTFQAPARS